jgi:hypothetical protein
MFFLNQSFDPNEKKKYSIDWDSVLDKYAPGDELELAPPAGLSFFEIPTYASDLTLTITDIEVDVEQSIVTFFVELTDKSKGQELIDYIEENHQGYLTLTHNIETSEGQILQRKVMFRVEQL